jgi:hypothetical protein
MAMLTSGAGIVDAIQRKDNDALLGCSLTVGAGALGLFGSPQRPPSFTACRVLLKLSKSGWMLYRGKG